MKAELQKLEDRAQLQERRTARAQEQLNIAKQKYEIELEKLDILKAEIRDKKIEIMAVTNEKMLKGRLKFFFNRK